MSTAGSKYSLITIGLVLTLMTGCLQLFAASSRPNILFIMSDDHTSQAIGAYGGRLKTLNPTPVIDQLAAEGMVMENAFCTNSICTPSRACIITGQYSAVNGIKILDQPLPLERHYLPVEMKKAGYQTAIIGKWHLKTLPTSFDYYKVLPGQGTYFDPVFYEKGATQTIKKPNYWKPKRIDTFKNAVLMNGHSSDCIADSALEWFKNKRDPQKPFFFMLHFKAPHDMFQYAPRYKSYLQDTYIPEPGNLLDRKNNGSIATRGDQDELIRYIGSSVGERHYRRTHAEDRHGPWYKDIDRNADDRTILRQTYQEYLKAYLRCVKGVDDNLKRVFDYLKAEGLYDNTVIMYTGDQGFYLGEHDYIDKRWGYEEGMRMPFIVRYPGHVKAGRTDAIVENVDYAPTMLDFAGVTTPSYMQGHSFKSILETGREPAGWKQAAYYHYWMHMAHHFNPAHIGIRTKRYKLLLFYGTDWHDQDQPETPPAWEFYDLVLDPTEDYNRYDDPYYANTIADLKKQLKELRAAYGEDDPKFPFNKVINEYWDYDQADREKAIAISHQYLEKMKLVDKKRPVK